MAILGHAKPSRVTYGKCVVVVELTVLTVVVLEVVVFVLVVEVVVVVDGDSVGDAEGDTEPGVGAAVGKCVGDALGEADGILVGTNVVAVSWYVPLAATPVVIPSRRRPATDRSVTKSRAGEYAYVGRAASRR